MHHSYGFYGFTKRNLEGNPSYCQNFGFKRKPVNVSLLFIDEKQRDMKEFSGLVAESNTRSKTGLSPSYSSILDLVHL